MNFEKRLSWLSALMSVISILFIPPNSALAGLSIAPRSGVLLNYVERPISGVNDRNFNRFWGDRLNFVDWTAVKPARISSATFMFVDGRQLTATMLSDRADCDAAACPLRLFDGNDMVAEFEVCEDKTRHEISLDHQEFLACGKSYRLSDTINWAVADHRPDERTLIHNGSLVSMVRLEDNSVEIRYILPRRGLPTTLKGELLFRGKEDNQHRFSGIAYTFKASCSPAGYIVSGAIDSNGEIILAGQAPTRDPRSCAVLGFTTQSPNAKLIFANVMAGE
jgi:hypothetical protein